MKKIILILLFFNSFIFSSSGMDFNPITYAVFGIALAFAIIAIVFMLGKLLNQVKLTQWAKTEIINTLISILLVALILSSMFAFFALDINVFENAYIYLDSQISKGISIISDLTRSSLDDQFESTYYAFIGTPFTASGGAGKSYRANYLAYSTQKDMVMNIVFATIASLEIQKIILQLIQTVSFQLFLPLAIVLRVFPGTRDIGNFVLAFIIGAAFVLPLTYMMYAGAPINFGSISIPRDYAMGDVSHIAALLPQAIFFPNLSLIIMTTAVMAIYKGFKQILV